ncbi:DUF4942 domain-containing protein [Priestia megaterium]
MFNNPNFYPTPEELLEKMIKDIDLSKIKRVLEPSAGKGNIIDFLVKKYAEMVSSSRFLSSKSRLDIDAIEIDDNLQHLLRGKSQKENTFKLVHNDFLTYTTNKPYDLIIMNPPFDKADAHLLRAIELLEEGGQIVCLTNSVTIKDPRSNRRKELKNKLEDLNAEVEFLKDTFTKAERKTNVEVALIKIKVPESTDPSVIIENLNQKEEFQDINEEIDTSKEIVPQEHFERVVHHYKYETSAGVKLIREYHKMSPYLIDSFKDDAYKSSILTLSVGNDKYSTSRSEMISKYIEMVRKKYWEELFTSKQFNDLFTSKLRTQYQRQIARFVDYDFSLYNIYTLRAQVNASVPMSVEETIMSLFDDLSYGYSMGNKKSIHLYNGWKTNKAWKINTKVIFPLNAFCNYSENHLDLDYSVREKLSDIEKALNYLGKGLTNHDELNATLLDTQKRWREAHETDKEAWKKFSQDIQFKYFKVDFKKKGTCHLTFTDPELLKRFNLFGSMKKGWLPPVYGKKNYADMTKEEKDVIDEFQGEQAYQEVMENKEMYLPEYTVMNLMGVGLPLLAELPVQEENSSEGVVNEETVVEAVLVDEKTEDLNTELSQEAANQVLSAKSTAVNEEQELTKEGTETNLTVTELQPVEANLKPKYTLKDLDNNTTLITSTKKGDVKAKPKVNSKDTVIIEASDVVVMTETSIDNKQKTLGFNGGNKAPLLLTTTYVEVEEVVGTKEVAETNAIKEANSLGDETKVVAIIENSEISSKKKETPVKEVGSKGAAPLNKKVSPSNKKKPVAVVKPKTKTTKEKVITDSDVVVVSSPLEEKSKKNLKSNAKKVKPKETVANKKIIKESKIVEDILPDFISINEDAKEGENIQLGFAI